MPESTGVLSRETAKLRNKLTGKGKKREREEEAEPSRAGANKGAAADSDDDDEEDSRARVITKKARVDPFASKGEGKKKKKKKETDPMAAPQAAGKTKAVPSVLPSALNGENDASSSKGAAAAQAPESDASSPAPTSKKKKKKKKHKEGAAQDGPHDDEQSTNPEMRERARSSPTSDLPARASKIAGIPQAPLSGPSCTRTHSRACVY